VSEASEIIQSAAHEDANIIFGAVVDPNMHGSVKITVIATGFTHIASVPAPAAQVPLHTPVDLKSYARAQEERPERLVVNGGPARVTVTRRTPIELPKSAASLNPQLDTSFNLETKTDDGEPASPLDVPAFLRRQEG
jgi:cell division protein FtsZ